MLRIHFTEADLARVQVAGVDPLWETVLGVQQLAATHRRAPVFALWRQRARAEVAEQGLRGAVGLLQTIAPEGAGYFPDFLTPAEAEAGLEAGLEAVTAAAPERLRAELVRTIAGRRPPRSVLSMVAGEYDGLREVSAALSLLYRTIIRPDWANVVATVESDRALRAHALRDGGVHGLLHSLRPAIQWNPPILSTGYPEDRDLYLNGRGLRLIPSFFCWYLPVALADPALPQVLVYPITHTWPKPSTTRVHHQRALASLLGHTRARIFAATANPATTSEIARRV